MSQGIVKKAFPYALDGTTFSNMAAGSNFPPSGYSLDDKTFDGLVAAGYVEQVKATTVPEDEDLNRRIIDAIDRKLSASSDEELKGLIARRGTPFSGNMVHAVLIAEAKNQLLREYEGAEPVLSVDPNAGVTEQPLSAPGAPTPPSAAAAIAQQQAAAESLEQNSEETDVNNGGGENKATNQFGDPVPAAKPADPDLSTMSRAELEAVAAAKGVDISQAKNKAEVVAAIKAAK